MYGWFYKVMHDDRLWSMGPWTSNIIPILGTPVVLLIEYTTYS